MEKLKTVVKFYDGKKAVYKDLFNDDEELFFCYQGAEYRFKKDQHWGDNKNIFNSVVSADETPKTIKVVDWSRRRFG